MNPLSPALNKRRTAPSERSRSVRDNDRSDRDMDDGEWVILRDAAAAVLVVLAGFCVSAGLRTERLAILCSCVRNSSCGHRQSRLPERLLAFPHLFEIEIHGFDHRRSLRSRCIGSYSDSCIECGGTQGAFAEDGDSRQIFRAEFGDYSPHVRWRVERQQFVFGKVYGVEVTGSVRAKMTDRPKAAAVWRAFPGSSGRCGSLRASRNFSSLCLIINSTSEVNEPSANEILRLR